MLLRTIGGKVAHRERRPSAKIAGHHAVALSPLPPVALTTTAPLIAASTTRRTPMAVLQSPSGPESGAALFSAQFVLLLAVTTLFGLSFSTYFLLPKFLAVELAADPVTIGSVTTIFWLAFALTVPLVGGQIDRRGRKAFA